LLQTNKEIKDLSIKSTPKIKVRILNHWDNLNRQWKGYAGFSLWEWKSLPDTIAEVQRLAWANASIGINATVLTNVNANALILTREYLVKLRHWRYFQEIWYVYLTARFSAPVEQVS
jgi:alpha-glucuronidase